MYKPTPDPIRKVWASKTPPIAGFLEKFVRLSKLALDGGSSVKSNSEKRRPNPVRVKLKATFERSFTNRQASCRALTRWLKVIGRLPLLVGVQSSLRLALKIIVRCEIHLMREIFLFDLESRKSWYVAGTCGQTESVAPLHHRPRVLTERFGLAKRCQRLAFWCGSFRPGVKTWGANPAAQKIPDGWNSRPKV